MLGHEPNLIKLSHSQVTPVPSAARGPSRTFLEVQASAEGGLDEGGAQPGDEGNMLETTRVPGHMPWDFHGEGNAAPVYFCHHCGFPIRIYGRLAPCQHVFCCDCALLLGQKGEKRCPSCKEPVQEVNLYSLDAL